MDETVKEKDSGVADEVVKASTDKLSAVFDWLVDQVPTRSSPSTESNTASTVAETVNDAEAKKSQMKSELATKADLERFYVALCRKLYDEGL